MTDVLPTTVQNVQQPASERRFNEPRLQPRGRRCSGAAEKEAHRTSTEHTDQCGGDPICYLHHIIWQYGRLLCNGKREGAGLREKKTKGEDESVAGGQLSSAH